MANTAHLEQLVRDLEAQLKDPTPTTPVGEPVAWLDRGVVSPETTFAALVTQVEGVGKVKLVVFKPNAMPIHKVGVVHISNPQHQIPNNATTVRNGAWDYPEGARVPSPHYEYHKRYITERIANIRREIEQLKAQESPKRQMAEATK